MTDAELRQELVERGPGWIRAQAARYGRQAFELPPTVAAGFRPFFHGDVDRARVAQERISNPPFYAELLARGAERAELLDFAAGMDSITFIDTIIIRPGAPLTPPLLFHELVHVVQYRLLGVERFAELYVDGWRAGRAFRDDPVRRYVRIPLEAVAYELQRRYEAAPGATFAVEPIVRQRLGL